MPVTATDPVAAAGLLAGAATRVPVPAFANRVQVFAKASGIGALGTPGNFYVSQYNASALPGNGYISTTLHALLAAPEWIELGNDTHFVVITADLVDIFQVRTIFELDI